MEGEEYESDLAVLLVLVRGSLSSPDEAVAPVPPSPPDHPRQFQELLHGIAEELQIPLEEVQDPKHKHTDVLHSCVSSQVALLVSDAILEQARTV